MIRTEALGKVFGHGPDAVTAVSSLDLEVRPGEVFGFLGPNGAGKTTTVRLLTCLIAPTSGRAWVGGADIALEAPRVRSQVGILTESPGVYERLSARRNLELYADLYGVEQAREQVERYLRLLGLWDRRDAEAGTFSKGMKQKLAIARALLHEPPVLFLDEPTSALDPESARTVRDSIEELRGEGRTILLCTHNLDEAERLCDRIAVFRSHVLALDTPENLRRRMFGRQTVVRVGNLAAEHVRVAAALPFAHHVTSEALGEGAGRILVDLSDPDSENPTLVRELVAAGAAIQSVDEARHSLEDVYLGLVQEGPS